MAGINKNLGLASNRNFGLFAKPPFLYALVLIIAMLFPFDIDLGSNNVKWFDSKNGIHFQGKGLIVSQADSIKLYEKLKQGNGLTWEVVVETDDVIQDGPAMIISHATAPNLRNFILAQSEDRLVVRLRTEQDKSNSTLARLAVPRVFKTPAKTHIAITYNFNEQCLFINGKQRTCDNVIKGKLSKWAPASQLVFGNKVSGDRPWRGKIYYAAIYNQALVSEVIAEKFRHVARSVDYSDSDPFETSTDPIIRYRFDERGGKLVKDSGAGAIELHLSIPDRLPWAATMFNFKQLWRPNNSFFSFNTLPHLLIFIPFGIFFHQFVKSRFESVAITILTVLMIGIIISFAFEMLQHFLPTRKSSIKDVIANLIGISVGVIINKIVDVRQ